MMFVVLLHRKRCRTEMQRTSVHLEKYKLLHGCGPCRLRCYDRI